MTTSPLHIAAVIPARFGSTRLPGKPLADIHGRPLIAHVLTQVEKAVDTLVVATDDERIEKAVTSFGGQSYMSTQAHVNGTSRAAEVAHCLHWDAYDYIINVQGDEAMITTEVIQALIEGLDKHRPDIGTLVSRVTEDAVLDMRDGAFVVTDVRDRAMYFSRLPIPHLHRVEREAWLAKGRFLKHIGIYAYTPEVLPVLASLPSAYPEEAESLEQNRWLAHGYPIQTVTTTFNGHSVDTPEDLELVRELLAPLYN